MRTLDYFFSLFSADFKLELSVVLIDEVGLNIAFFVGCESRNYRNEY